MLRVELNNRERLYWRAKLAAAGFFFEDEAATGGTMLFFLAFNVYSFVVTDLDAGLPDVWRLVRDIMASRHQSGQGSFKQQRRLPDF